MASNRKRIAIIDSGALFELWDRERNSKIGLDPSKLSIASGKKAFWRCANGHGWSEPIKTIARRKHKCFYCTGRLVTSGENDLRTLYPDLAAEWDEEKNGISADRVSPKDTEKYWWKCKNGHPSFLRSVCHRVERNDVCPYCSGHQVHIGVNDLETLFPNIASEWDYERNEGVLPSQVSPNSYKSFFWICPKGHHYKKKVHARTHDLRFVNCPKCLKALGTSFPEQAIFYYAKVLFPDAISRWRGLSESGLELDIYLPSIQVGIEYDGKPFHSSKEAKEREWHKYQTCKKLNIRLIRIKEGSEEASNEAADETYYLKKRPRDSDMDRFLIALFDRLISRAGKRTSISDPSEIINIQRDTPKILEYLIDTKASFGALYPDLAKNWDVDGNGKLTPYMLSPGSLFTVHFLCERCGARWSTSPYLAIKGNRKLCKKCSMSDGGIKTTARALANNGSLADCYPRLAQEWDQEANGNLTPRDIPSKHSKEVFWKCPKCGYSWKQSPSSRIHGTHIAGCPHCSGRVALPGVDDLETLYPDIAKEWDYERNGEVLPSQIRPHSNAKRFWICEKHKVSYEQAPNNRLHHIGCPVCKGENNKTKNGRKIEQYTKDLEYLRTYLSPSEAARSLDMSPGAIRLAAIHGYVCANSYWKYEGTEFSSLRADKRIPVVAVDPKSGEETEYPSAFQAGKAVGVGHNQILCCCKGKGNYNTAGGLYWHFKDGPLQIRKNKTTARPVIGTNPITKETIEFESARAAGTAMGITSSAIVACCKGRTKTAGGHHWKYKK